MGESGEFVTIAELAEREGIAPPYMTHVLRLTLLAAEVHLGVAVAGGAVGHRLCLGRSGLIWLRGVFDLWRRWV